MKSLSIIVVLSLVAFAIAFPVAEDEEEAPQRVGSNLLFQQLNELLKREITKEIKDDSLEIGDKYNGNDGKFQIQIQQFSTNQGFPVFFKPNDEEVLDDKEIIALVSDFDGSSEYAIKKDDSGCDSSEEEKDVKKEDSKSTVETSTKKISESSTGSSSKITAKKVDSESTTEKTTVAKVVESTSTQTTPSTTTIKN